MRKITDKDSAKSKKREELLKLYESSLKMVSEGEITKGTVITVTASDVIVDVGLKSEGIVSRSEFKHQISEGDEIEVLIEDIENDEGVAVLSKEKADFVKAWERVKQAYENSEIVEGKLVRKVKGGAIVDLFSVNAFLPTSQIDLYLVKDPDRVLKEPIRLRVISLSERNKNIIVSRRAVIEEERQKKREKVLETLESGEVKEGVVKNITDFGAFIEIDGVDGLLHITDMSWGRVSHPSQVLSVGETVKVVILDVDRENERLSLGLKQMTPNPWENIEERYPVGTKAKGKVVNIMDYGAFIEIERGVDGLVHISEMSWTQRIKHPSQIMSMGDQVEAVVLSIDKDNERLSLGLKQAEVDPWINLEEKFPVNSIHTGWVRSLVSYGAFVELDKGITGLVHISDMSWMKRTTHPSQLLKKGEKAEVVILNIDKKNRRISLSLRQSLEDPWRTANDRYKEGKTVPTKITRILDRGIEVVLEDGIEAFIPLSRLKIESSEELSEKYTVGDELKLKVVDVIKENRRLILTEKAK
jgi:small subunit ribosomal protein S1